MAYFDDQRLAQMNANINTPPSQAIWDDPLAGFGRMGEAFSGLASDPLFMMSLSMLTNHGVLSPGAMQNALMAKQWGDKMNLTKEEKEELKKREKEAKAAEAQAARGLLGGAPAPGAPSPGLLGGGGGVQLPSAAMGMLGNYMGAPHGPAIEALSLAAANGRPPMGGAPAPAPPQPGLVGPMGPRPHPMGLLPPFDGAPAGEGQPTGAGLVGSDPRALARLRMNLSLMQNGTLEQRVDARKDLTKQLSEDSRIEKDITGQHRWVEGPLEGKLVFPGVEYPTNNEVRPFKKIDPKKLSAVHVDTLANWDAMISALPPGAPQPTQQDADEFAAAYVNAQRDKMSMIVGPDWKQTIYGAGTNALRSRFFDYLRGGAGESAAADGVPGAMGPTRGGSDPLPGETFDQFRQRVGSGRPGGAMPNPITQFESKTLEAGRYLADLNSDLLEAMRGVDVTSYWNAGAKLLEETSVVKSFFESDEYQSYLTVSSAWADRVLRLATGAQANESEVRNFQNMFIPQPGDKPLRVAQKNRQRIKRAISEIRSGLLRQPSTSDLAIAGFGSNHERIRESELFIRYLERTELPLAEANYRRVREKKKPFTPEEWATLQKKKADVTGVKKAIPKLKPAKVDRWVKEYGGVKPTKTSTPTPAVPETPPIPAPVKRPTPSASDVNGWLQRYK